jgi:hypothetical protein
MKLTVKCSLAIALVAMLFVSNARAQFAFELSGSYDVQHGTYKAPCGCTFANGSGFGYMAAASMDLVHFLGITIGVKPAYEVQQFTSEEIDSASLAAIQNGDKEEVKINLLSVEPFIRYDIPSTGVFLQASPAFKYVLSSSFHHAAGSAAEEAEVGFNPDSAITLKSALYNAKGTIGYSLSLLGISLEPSVSAAFPITNLSDISDAKNWAVTTLYLSLAVRL